MEAKAREEGRRGSPGAKGESRTRRYSRETKLRAVRLVLEEGFARKDVGREIGVCKSCLNRWVRNYRLERNAGLEDRPPRSLKRRRCPSRSSSGDVQLIDRAEIRIIVLSAHLFWNQAEASPCLGWLEPTLCAAVPESRESQSVEALREVPQSSLA
jgi:transposase-like protein